MTWINQALAAGGVLAISSRKKGKLWLRATMSWPGEQSVTGGCGLSVESALAHLEAALCDDAADQMLMEGAV